MNVLNPRIAASSHKDALVVVFWRPTNQDTDRDPDDPTF